MKLSAKHLISINDLTKKDIELIFKTADKLYRRKLSALRQKTLAMIFEKSSTRTRISFEVAMTQLGGHALDLTTTKLQASRGEAVKDTAAVVSRYVDGIMARLYSHEHLLEMARHSSVPVINGLTDFLHPCQALADLYTIKKKKGLKNVKLVYIGDANNNVCHSLMHCCHKLDVNMAVCCPKKYLPDEQIMKNTHNSIKITDSISEALKDADVVYTDTWVSMGQEKEAKKKIADLKPYQVNSKLMHLAKSDAIFMHCLPAHRGQEVTDKVIDSEKSVVYDQAENRLHVQKAILYLLMKK